MGLDKRSVPVPITGGVEAAGDDFGDDLGMARVRNARFRLDGQIGKRNGEENVLSTGLPIVTPVDRNCILETDGVPLVLTNAGAYRRNINTNKWAEANEGAPRPSRIVTSPLVRTNDTLKYPDCAVIGTLLCAVWSDPETAQGFYGFWDVAEDTPRLISGPTAFEEVSNTDTLVDHLRVVAVGTTSLTPDRFVVVGRVSDAASADLRQTQYLLSAGDFLFDDATTLIVVNADPYVTVERDATGQNYYVAASAADYRFRRYSANATFLASMIITHLPIAMVHNSVAGKIVGACADGYIVHAAEALGGGPTNVLAIAAPASGAPFTFSRAAICLDISGSMWFARSGLGQYTTGSPSCTQLVRLDSAFALSGEAVVGQYVLAGQGFYSANTGPMMVVADQYSAATTVPTATTIAYKAAPVGYYVSPVLRVSVSAGVTTYTAAMMAWGRFDQDTAYLYDTGAHLPRIAVDLVGDQQTTVPLRTYACASVGADDFASLEGRKIDLVTSCFYRASPARNVTSQGLRIAANGVGTTCDDGVAYAEMTPPCPGYLAMDGNDTTITQLTNVYFGDPSVTGIKFIVVWRWLDAKGNVHRSAPSSPYWAIDTELWANDGFGQFNPGKLCFPKHAPTGLMGDTFTTPEVEVYVYPIGIADAAYRLVGIVPPADDPTEEGRCFIATVNTSTLVPTAPRYAVICTDGWWLADGVAATSRPELYTETGELEAWPSPPLLDVVSTQSRLWGLSAEGRRLDVWYTKPIVEARAPEWNPSNRLQVPQEGGDCVALAALDDKVVALKRRKCFVIFGEPGDVNGDGSSLQKPRLVSGDVGCIDVNSVVEGPFGVAFLSERGWYALSRDLTLTFIGQPMIDALVDDLSWTAVPQPAVLCSTLVPSESEVRWSIAEAPGVNTGLAAVWNYRLNKWSVWSSHDVRSACVADGVEWRLGFSVVRKETPNLWTTLGSDSQEITSPWIKLNGIAGFQRIWRIVLTFRWYSGAIAVRTATDYTDTVETIKSWSAVTLATLVDAATGRVQLVIQPTVQRCESLRVIIAGLGTTGESGRGFEIVGCQIDVGVKKGSNKKLPAAARG